MNLRRAYRELLIGDDYNDSLQPHLHLTEVATQWGGAFDSLWQWQVISVGLTVNDLPPEHIYADAVHRRGVRVHSGKKLWAPHPAGQ